ncbi:MAG: hypothetical protein JSS83_00740 [Cyanobacteria bacterium SZAS LIN-3]|nr:hypothetical protein [Cyanobacteria bacterium SZAS LIN-3]
MFSTVNSRNVLKASSIFGLGLAVVGLWSAVSPALAAGPNAAVPVVPDMVLGPADQALAKDVGVLENRFFFHSYSHDPMEKRIERLELLTLGAAQGGSNAERLTRLKQAVVERDKEAARTIAREQKGDGELAAKTNYPILGTLEWRVLKKTYPSESIDQRLGRMESQLFGMPAQAMSYVDRIERLKKTVGMDIAATPPSASAAKIPGRQLGMGGPLPRAGRNGSAFNNFNGFNTGGGLQIQIGPNGIVGNGFGGNSVGRGSGKDGGDSGNGSKSGYLYDENGNVTGWYQNNSQTWTFPGNSAAPNPGQSGQGNIFEAMDQMNRHMNELMRGLNSPGFGGFGGFGNFGGLDDSFTITPQPNPGKVSPKMPQQAPQPKKFTSPNHELPPYTDPNSI